MEVSTNVSREVYEVTPGHQKVNISFLASGRAHKVVVTAVYMDGTKLMSDDFLFITPGM